MKVTHRVKDSNMNTIGFIGENGQFYTDYIIKENIELVENLKYLSNGVFRADVELPIKSWVEIMKTNFRKLNMEYPMIRDIQKDLLTWKKWPTRKILQLEGSRQIGKTTELKKFGYKYYEYVIYINLATHEKLLKEMIDKIGVNALGMEFICRQLNIPHYVDNRRTLFIIDEIQISSEIYNRIREFESNLSCDIIVTGSYLGQVLKKEYFKPAGTIMIMKMFPLSFKEFARVFKKESLLKNIDVLGNSDISNYTELYSLYDLYKKIGGYPEVVYTYKKSKNINISLNIYESIFTAFERESGFYFKDSKEPLIFKSVFQEAIRLMLLEKKGNGGKLVEMITELVKKSQKMLVSRDEVSNAVQWLIYSGILGECDLCNNGSMKEIIPARRFYYTDCGLLYHICSKMSIEQSDLDGLLTETFAYSELNRLYNEFGLTKRVKGDTPCFSTYQGYELDFMVLSKDNVVYGIEVKTQKGDPKSLKVYLDKKLIDKGILAKRTKGGKSDTYYTIPIFTISTHFPYIQ